MSGKNPLPKIILIVEDYTDYREFMKLLLETFGYLVIEASDGFQAVERIKHQIPDLILMDIAMPLMDGLTATRIIRKLNNGAEVPIIAFTGSCNLHFKEAKEAGCNEVVRKPFEHNKLELLLNNYLAAEIV